MVVLNTGGGSREVNILENSAQPASNGSAARHTDTKFQQKSMHLIGCFNLILNERFTNAMQSPHCLLRFRTGLNETH
ncbi:Uncharacterised protein [Klebsiella variicola]|nr:hypothetical protein SM85_05479 [Klebsiella variicola]SAV20339.1 Uncharacterised protein [Klebsiella variicola]